MCLGLDPGHVKPLGDLWVSRTKLAYVGMVVLKFSSFQCLDHYEGCTNQDVLPHRWPHNHGLINNGLTPLIALSFHPEIETNIYSPQILPQ